MPIKWLRKALKNLAQVHTYIAYDDPEAAVKVIQKIRTGVDHLSQFPTIGKAGRVEGTRELLIANTPYFVVYRIKGKTIEIMRVFHASRRYPD
jgi:toxin ParE1/3/4